MDNGLRMVDPSLSGRATCSVECPLGPHGTKMLACGLNRPCCRQKRASGLDKGHTHRGQYPTRLPASLPVEYAKFA